MPTLSLRSHSGFSMPELLIAVFILSVIFSGTMMVFIKTSELNEISANMSAATVVAANRVHQVESAAFSNIVADYDNVAFTTTGLNGRGVTYVDDTNPDLLVVTTVVSWRQKDGRLFGEDADLDGFLDGGEDANGNGRLDSPVELTTERYDS